MGLADSTSVTKVGALQPGAVARVTGLGEASAVDVDLFCMACQVVPPRVIPPPAQLKQEVAVA